MSNYWTKKYGSEDLAPRQCDYLFKMLVVGDSGVGKSSLMYRFVDDSFQPSFISTIGVDFQIATVEQDNKLVRMQIWDTAGQERFQAICKNYYRGAHGAMIVYDATDPSSLEAVRERWLPAIRRHAKQGLTTILVGNKTDLVEAAAAKGVDTAAILEEAKLLAEEEGMQLLEASAKTGTHVEAAFHSLVRELVEGVVGVAGRLDAEKVRTTTTDIQGNGKGKFFASVCNFFSRRRKKAANKS